MFNHRYKRFNADNLKKNSAHRTTSIQRLNDERNKISHGGDEMRRKSAASDEIWKRGYNSKPTKERSDKTRSGESRGIAVLLCSTLKCPFIVTLRPQKEFPWEAGTKKRLYALRSLACCPFLSSTHGAKSTIPNRSN
jgi:hypothetical protein